MRGTTATHTPTPTDRQNNKPHRQIERQTDRQTDKQTDRQTVGSGSQHQQYRAGHFSWMLQGLGLTYTLGPNERNMKQDMCDNTADRVPL